MKLEVNSLKFDRKKNKDVYRKKQANNAYHLLVPLFSSFMGSVVCHTLVGTGRAISVLFGINGVRNKRSHLVGPPYSEFEACFSATAGWHYFLKRLN